jgi:hypothetical protein
MTGNYLSTPKIINPSEGLAVPSSPGPITTLMSISFAALRNHGRFISSAYKLTTTGHEEEKNIIRNLA